MTAKTAEPTPVHLPPNANLHVMKSHFAIAQSDVLREYPCTPQVTSNISILDGNRVTCPHSHEPGHSYSPCLLYGYS